MMGKNLEMILLKVLQYLHLIIENYDGFILQKLIPEQESSSTQHNLMDQRVTKQNLLSSIIWNLSDWVKEKLPIVSVIGRSLVRDIEEALFPSIMMRTISLNLSQHLNSPSSYLSMLRISNHKENLLSKIIRPSNIIKKMKKHI